MGCIRMFSNLRDQLDTMTAADIMCSQMSFREKLP